MKQTIGLDISKRTIDVAILCDNQYKTAKFDNSKSGFIKLNQWIKNNNLDNSHICMEATGSYYEAVADYLFDQNYRISVVNPLKIKRFSETVFSRTKTDKQDAKLIADFCCKMQPELWIKPTANERRLDDLITFQKQLKEQLVMNKNQLKSATDKTVKNDIQKIIKHLNELIKKNQNDIRSLIKEDEKLNNKFNKIKTITGIGEISAEAIINFFCGRNFESDKQYVAFLGMSPEEKSSGSSVRRGGRLCKNGHRKAKGVYFMPALTAYRKRSFPNFINRLEEKGKAKMVIVTAIMRKLATIAFHIYMNETDFDPSRYKKMA